MYPVFPRLSVTIDFDTSQKPTNACYGLNPSIKKGIKGDGFPMQWQKPAVGVRSGLFCFLPASRSNAANPPSTVLRRDGVPQRLSVHIHPCEPMMSKCQRASGIMLSAASPVSQLYTASNVAEVGCDCNASL